ncbi:MAG: NAD(P)H-dependent oxidoreductase [bacterium]
MRILGLSGSLRAASSNSAVLRLAAHIAPPSMSIAIYDALATLPYFNPDLDRELDDPALPLPVRALREAIANSDALLISSPEYAHGVSGMFKNALDWLVGGPEMVAKPIALINTSPHATHAIAALAETLRTMSATLVEDAHLSIALPRGKPDDALASDQSITAPLLGTLRALERHCVSA